MSEDAVAALTADLERELRLMSTQSVLISQAIADHIRMNSSDLESMDFLNLYGPMTPGRLAELTGLSTGGVTRLVDRLVARGILRREADPDDRRKIILHSRAHEFPGIRALWEPLSTGLAGITRGFSVEQLKVVLDFVTLCNELSRVHLAWVRNAGSDGHDPIIEALTPQPGDTPA